MTSEAVAKATLEQAEIEVGNHDDIPMLKSVVQSGNIDVIKSARQREPGAADAQAAAANRQKRADPACLSSDYKHVPDLVCESDLERTIDAIIEQHVVSMRSEISAVLQLHGKTSGEFKVAGECDKTNKTIPESA